MSINEAPHHHPVATLRSPCVPRESLVHGRCLIQGKDECCYKQKQAKDPDKQKHFFVIFPAPLNSPRLPNQSNGISKN